MKMFELRDARAEAFTIPFFTLTRAMAMREIQQRMERDKALVQFAEDFSIHECGEWEQADGIPIGHPPVHVIDVIELIPKKD